MATSYHLCSWYGGEKLTVFCRPPVKNEQNQQKHKKKKKHAKNSEAMPAIRHGQHGISGLPRRRPCESAGRRRHLLLPRFPAPPPAPSPGTARGQRGMGLRFANQNGSSFWIVGKKRRKQLGQPLHLYIQSWLAFVALRVGSN